MGERKIMTTDTRSDTAVTTETSCSASVCMKKKSVYSLSLLTNHTIFIDLVKSSRFVQI